MRNRGGLPRIAAFVLALGGAVTMGIDVRQLERVQVLEDDKRAHITALAVLEIREEDKVCGTGLRMCPSSASGGCCPENFSCGTDSCYATSREPSTCGTLVGWHACDAVHGGT